MLTKHGILVLFAARALSALSCSVERVKIQDSSPYLASDQMGFDTESTAATIDSSGPQVFLDDAVLVGNRIGDTQEFLGIPYAHPP